MKKHFRNIDVIKGVCILIVIFEHSKWTKKQWLRLLIPFWDRIAIPCFMVISGFVYCKSIQGLSLKQQYDPKLIFHKLKRYLIPFLFVFLLETSVYAFAGTSFARQLINKLHFTFNQDPISRLSIPSIVKGLLTGGYGPGNYYTPVMIQLALLFPLIYQFMKKFKYKGLALSCVFSLFSELWQYYFQIPNEVYRYLIFRHMMNLCFGIYLALGLYKKNKILNCTSLLIGFVYIVLHSYYGWTPFFFNKSWADVCFVPCFFFIPIIAFFIQKENITFRPLETIGKASYHIYLTQMVYYNFVKKDLALKILGNQFTWCFSSIFICSIFGLMFYFLEKRILSSISENQ